MQKRIDTVSEATLKELVSWDWPGNIRELENFIERAVILSRDGVLTNPLPSNHQETVTVISNLTTKSELSRRLKETLTDQEKKIIEAALTASQGKIGGPNGAAARLGIPPSTLDSKMQHFGIKRNSFVAAF